MRLNAKKARNNNKTTLCFLVFRLRLLIIISVVGIIFNFHQLQSIDFRDVGSQDKPLIIFNTTHTIGMEQPLAYKKVARPPHKQMNWRKPFYFALKSIVDPHNSTISQN